MADEWWYRVFGQEFGPLTLRELQRAVQTLNLGPSDEVRCGQQGKWRRAGSIGKLAALLPYELPAQAATGVARSSSQPERLRPTPTLQTVSAQVGATPNGSSRVISNADRSRQVSTSAAAPRSRTQTPQASTVPAAKPSRIETIEVLNGVREALKARNLPGLAQIELSFADGTLTMTGTLSSEGERLLAIRIGSQSPGVSRVVNELAVATVSRRPTPASVPVIATVKASAKVASGPGVFSRLLEAIKGEHRNHAIGAAAAIAVLGFWFSPRGPVRPVAVHPVKGRVVIDGQPLANAAVVLHRVGNSKLPAHVHPRGKATADGSFALETFDAADGAPEGEFVATVFLTQEQEIDGEKQAGPNLLPVVYSMPETSPLKLRITSATSELQPLELRR